MFIINFQFDVGASGHGVTMWMLIFIYYQHVYGVTFRICSSIILKNQFKGNDIISILGLLAIFYAIFLVKKHHFQVFIISFQF